MDKKLIGLDLTHIADGGLQEKLDKELEKVLSITKDKFQSYETSCYYRTLEKIYTKDKMTEVIRNSLFTGVSL